MTSQSSGSWATAARAGASPREAVIRVYLPFPKASLFPNRSTGRHWALTRSTKDIARDSAYILTKQALGARSVPDGYLPLDLTFCAPDRRHRDRDNCLAAAKHALDGVARALGVDDRRFDPVTLRRGDPVKGGMLIVEIPV